MRSRSTSSSRATKFAAQVDTTPIAIQPGSGMSSILKTTEHVSNCLLFSHCTLQENLFHNPWQLLIATIFLNRTGGERAIPLALAFLESYPEPATVLEASVEDVAEFLKPIGLSNTRARTIKRFTREYYINTYECILQLAFFCLLFTLNFGTSQCHTFIKPQSFWKVSQ